jgi:extracellular matrix protein 14
MSVHAQTRKCTHPYTDTNTQTNLDIWRVSARTIDVRVSPSLAPGLRAIIPSSASVRTFVSNVQDLVDASSPVPTTEPPKGGWGVESIASPFHDGYHVLEDVYGFGDALAEVFGLRSFEVGTTAEGRAIRAWSASGNTTEPGDGDGGGDGGGDDGDDGGDGDDGSDTTRLEDKYEIVIQAGQHAREWVSTSAALFFLHSLLLDAAADATSPAAKLLKVFTITVIPVVNPDGFAYSHDHSRMWKKNRQEVGGLLCKGIDLNGNWGYQFQPSRLACSDSYKGSYAFEALETRAVANYLANGTTPEGQPRAHRVKAFIDLHSYGQLCKL